MLIIFSKSKLISHLKIFMQIYLVILKLIYFDWFQWFLRTRTRVVLFLFRSIFRVIFFFILLLLRLIIGILKLILLALKLLLLERVLVNLNVRLCNLLLINLVHQQLLLILLLVKKRIALFIVLIKHILMLHWILTGLVVALLKNIIRVLINKLWLYILILLTALLDTLSIVKILRHACLFNVHWIKLLNAGIKSNLYKSISEIIYIF